MDAILAMWKYRRLLWATTKHELKGKFGGSIIGPAWYLVYPLLFLAMYAMVYIYILQVRAPNLPTREYVLIIFAGLVPFLGFAEAFGTGVPSVVSNSSLVRNTLFPIELVVAKNVVVGHTMMMVGMMLVWAAAVFEGKLFWTDLLVPVIFMLQLVFTAGIVWVFASLNVFFRDLTQAAPILVLFLMMVSPIGYTKEMIPPHLVPYLYVNPIAILIDLYRDAVVVGYVSPWKLFAFAAIAFGVFTLGFKFISRLKPMFSDYV